METPEEKEAEGRRIARSLTNVKPTDKGIDRIEEVRDVCKSLAFIIIEECPRSRERSLALTHLEETAMWAVKSIVLEGEG